MFFDKEFIWYNDHYVYHITKSENVENITKKGLVPFCGERSISVGDTRKAIYFFDYIYSAEEWAYRLYEDNIELELLKFNLKRRKWYMVNQEIGDFYITSPILPENIEILKRITEDNNIFSINEISYQKKLIWEPLKK